MQNLRTFLLFFVIFCVGGVVLKLNWRTVPGQDDFGINTGPERMKLQKLVFRSHARRAGTDKVTAHSYDDMYGPLLFDWKDTPLTLLEIGLGCWMGYGKTFCCEFVFCVFVSSVFLSRGWKINRIVEEGSSFG